MKDIQKMNGIPLNFCNANYEPVLCETVGDVIEALKRLPAETPIDQGMGEGVRLTVYNVSSKPHLEFESVE